MPKNFTFAASAVVALLVAVALGTQARAGETTVTLCPSSATPGGFGGTASDVAGPLDGTCGTNSAVTLSLPASTDYGKLEFSSSVPGYPSSLGLGGLLGLSANVSTTGSDQPYFMLAFTDPSDSLGQAASGNQILLIEFQPSTLSGDTLAMDPNTTLFNLYDNTTGTYLQGPNGQQNKKTLAAWLTEFPSLGDETLQGVWIGEGLDSGNTGAESVTINSLAMSYVPEPASISLIAVALAGIGLSRRKRAH